MLSSNRPRAGSFANPMAWQARSLFNPPSILDARPNTTDYLRHQSALPSIDQDDDLLVAERQQDALRRAVCMMIPHAALQRLLLH